ncbi:MAG: tyrosine-type recombinase/integrase [Vicinamibacterales bacterium]
MLYRRGGVWWYKFRFAGRLFRESAKSTSKALARRAERKRHQKLEEAIHGIRKRTAPVTFSVAAHDWLALKTPTWAPKSAEVEQRNLKHLKPAFGSLLLIDITAEDIADYQKTRLKAGASPKTVNLEVGTLRAILRRHRLWAGMQPDVRMLSVHEAAGKALTEGEERRLLDACRSRRSRALLPIVTLALHTGMRRGEIQSLRWSQIDFLNRTLTVGTTKTAAGTGRVIPLNERALLTLQAWATNFPERSPEHYVFPSEHYGFAGNDRKPHAKTMDPTIPAGEIKTAWEAAKARAGVECRFHDLRHTACTRLLERGASLPIVASIMGWSAGTTAKMAKRYGHIGADVQRAALDALSETPQPRGQAGKSKQLPEPDSGLNV